MDYSVYLRRCFMNEIDRLIYLTIAYSSCFSFALNKSEILRRLPLSSNLKYLFDGESKSPEKILISEQKINNSLKKLLELSLIKTDGEYFYLQKKDLQNRKQRTAFYDLKNEEAMTFVKIAKNIPFVKAVALTGSAAVGNAVKEDDLDFMIICQSNTLWLTRFLLILLIKLKNKRPKVNKPGAWCVNLLLDEHDLILDNERRGLYEAYEILQMKFVFDRGGYEKLFLNANNWLRKYLAFYGNYKFGEYKENKSFSLINQLFFFVQRIYRLAIFGKESFSLSPTQAFFNDIDFKNKLQASLEKKIIIKE